MRYIEAPTTVWDGNPNSYKARSPEFAEKNRAIELPLLMNTVDSCIHVMTTSTSFIPLKREMPEGYFRMAPAAEGVERKELNSILGKNTTSDRKYFWGCVALFFFTYFPYFLW